MLAMNTYIQQGEMGTTRELLLQPSMTPGKAT
jgi:hypothetical protein